MSTTASIPHRLERTFELPGTPEQVWAAIATADGISSWFLRTDLEERLGGTVITHMGPDDSSRGVVVTWDPPLRFAYEEPEWADLVGQPGADVTPLRTEFVVEARSGGTCVLTLVTSAFGTGAEWENEFFEELETGWIPFFDNLRLYLAQFPGQRATHLEVTRVVGADVDAMWPGVRGAFGATDIGREVKVNGATGVVRRITEAPGTGELLVQLSDPIEGFLGAYLFGRGDGGCTLALQGYLFSDDAAAYAERERAGWQAWLDSLPVPAT